MNRRTFLKGLSGSVAGLALGKLSPTLAQTGVPGVSDAKVKLGMSAPFTGLTAEIGNELYRGSLALYSEVNAQGGLYGREIELVALDDGGDAARAVENTLTLLNDEQVFMLTNYVGDDTMTRVLPLMRSYGSERENRVMMAGNYSGAQIQRDAPYRSHCWNVRAGVQTEMEILVAQLWKQGVRKFGAFYQADAAGRAGPEAVRQALLGHGAGLQAEATCRADWTYEEHQATLYAAVKHLRGAGCEVVICSGTMEPVHSFIHAARNLAWLVPVAATSTVGSDALLRRLTEHNNHDGIDLFDKVIVSEVVPPPEAELPATVQYRRLMDGWNPAPPEVSSSTYLPKAYSFAGLEGFLNARVVVEALRVAGENLYRGGLYEAMEGISGSGVSDFDIGLDQSLSYTDDLHQGLKSTYLIAIEQGRWVPLRDWAAAL